MKHIPTEKASSKSISSKAIPTETKKEIVEYYKTHNVIDTIQKFGISRASLARYVRKYDGTEMSLMDGRTTRENVYKFSVKETEMLLASLKKYNPLGRRRNIIEPSFEEIYNGDLNSRESDPINLCGIKQANC